MILASLATTNRSFRYSELGFNISHLRYDFATTHTLPSPYPSSEVTRIIHSRLQMTKQYNIYLQAAANLPILIIPPLVTPNPCWFISITFQTSVESVIQKSTARYNPRLLRYSYKCLQSSNGTSQNKCMDITLSFICLSHKQVGHVPPNMILITDCIASKNLL